MTHDRQIQLRERFCSKLFTLEMTVSNDVINHFSPCRRWICRVARASLPFQAGLLLLLGVASFAPIYREEIICSVQNTFRDSFEPMLQWTNGSPPI